MYVIQRFLKALKYFLMEYQRDVAQIRFSGIIVSCIVGSGTRGDKLQNVENRLYGFEEHFNLKSILFKNVSDQRCQSQNLFSNVRCLW